VRFKQIRLPKGYHFKITRNAGCKGECCHEYLSHRIELMDGNVWVGRIDLHLKSPNAQGIKWFETHSNLGDIYRNRKLGALLYAKAAQWCLRQGYRVSSSTSPSPDAQRVWNGKTIRKYVRIIRRPSCLGTTQYHCYCKHVQP